MTWTGAMMEILPCGHSKAQHMYAEGKEIHFEPCELFRCAKKNELIIPASLFLFGFFVFGLVLGVNLIIGH
jgi:hypothetical protein